ncbi:unnamed protein product [Bursaphelenchus xylophilus]|uniref:molybdopterin molybdotransferase n=1 Tax=Bursaphelenchus xylophilus TaxID=6326 RepID=A0A1I7RT61_BURXY|nr:unnamed protein product [Bursaphelenchus xylophilus]CAG9122588.1 unnamed protein product [Bursaphelenchus xylophilus]
MSSLSVHDLRFKKLEDLEKAAKVTKLSTIRFLNQKSHVNALFLRILRVFNYGIQSEDPESCFILLSRVQELIRIFLKDRKWADLKSRNQYGLKLEAYANESEEVVRSLKYKLRNVYSPRSMHRFLRWIKWSDLLEMRTGKNLLIDFSYDNRSSCARFTRVYIKPSFITRNVQFYALLMHLPPEARNILLNITDFDRVILTSDKNSPNFEYIYDAIEMENCRFRPRQPPVLVIKGSDTHAMICCRQMRIGILTVSDTCSENPEKDKSGPILLENLQTSIILKNPVFSTAIVADDKDKIKKQLILWAKDHHVIITTGGTGFAPRDVTPEATREVIQKPCPGIVVALIQEGLKFTPMAALSRPEAGICGQCLIVNLPGSPKACQQSLPVLEPLLNHAVQLLRPEISADSSHPN